MDHRACITVFVPGNNRVISLHAVLSDVARKLGNVDLAAGTHEIIILNNGSIMLDGTVEWEPKPSPVDPAQKKVG